MPSFGLCQLKCSNSWTWKTERISYYNAWEHQDMWHFLKKNFSQERGCTLGSHPGSTPGDLLLVIPDLGRLCKTWLRQQKWLPYFIFHISFPFSIFQPGFHRLQDITPCKQDSCPCSRQCHGWVRGLSIWLFAMGSLGKKGGKKQELPEIWINIEESEVTWVFTLVPTKAAGETFLSNPHLKGGRRALHQQGQFDGIVLMCQEPWCHEISIQGLVNVWLIFCVWRGKGESAAALSEGLPASQQLEGYFFLLGRSTCRRMCP